jgi:predicted phage terminase large subunit-like protein
MQLNIQIHPIQAAFRASDATYRGFVGGISSGKSWVGAYDLLRRAKPNRLYLTAAPTYRMLEDASWRTLRELAIKLKFFNGENKGDMTMRLGNGAEILGRSTEDPERLRGPNLSGIWMDEASQMKRAAFDICIGRLREQGEQGWLTATFTPKGRSHWTYEVFGREVADIALFHARTDQNPFNPATFVGGVSAQYAPQLARQELKGEFVALEGSEWPAEWFCDDLWFDNFPANVASKVMAVDPSKGKKETRLGDYSAFVKLMIDTEGHCWAEADLGRYDLSALSDIAVGHYRSFWPDTFAVEVNQFQELLSREFFRVGRTHGVSLPIHEITNTRPKIERIRRITPFLARRELHFRDTPGTHLLVDQLMDFPNGDHDDGPDALDMALQEGFRMLAGPPPREELVY